MSICSPTASFFGSEKFCDKYLDAWRELGLNNIAVSIHSADEKEQALVYGVKSYPALETIVSNVEKHGSLASGLPYCSERRSGRFL